MDLLANLSQSLQDGDDEKVAALTKEALAAGMSAKQILDNALISGMTVIGNRFKAHEIFLPDVLLSARAMYAGLELLKPLFLKDDIPSRGKVVVGTVQGDLHDIGKNLVSIMLKGAGYEVIDLGNDVPPERFVDTAVAQGAAIIGLSALLTTTMPVMSQVAALLKERGLTGRIKLIIGGAPVSDAYAREIGADAYGFDAVKAVEIVDRFLMRQ
ncbi:MAG: corrinoid protein [candidate division Zixibacteria bacterium]|nr:corrinoid protein [candidate division Zixibacteria bacterium]